MVFGFTRFATVCDISNITTITINSVSHSLDSTIWKSNMVLTIGTITIAMFIGTKIKTRVFIFDDIGIFIICGSIFICGFWVVG